MQKLIDVYKDRKQEFTTELTAVKKELFIFSMLRFVVFLCIVFGLYFFFGNAKAMFLSFLIGAVVFAFLLTKYTQLQAQKSLLQKKIALNITEISVLKGEFNQLDTGKEFTDATHFYSNDIDLFGEGSFFQYTNRTATKSGKIKLAGFFTANKITKIKKKQQAIRELSKKIDWRQQFTAIAQLVSVTKSTETITHWVLNHKVALPLFLKRIPLFFSLISIGIITVIGFDVIGFQLLAFWFFVGLIITGIYFKSVQNLYKNANDAKAVFRQYYQLLALIESVTFKAEILQEKQQQIKSHTLKASIVFKQFSKILDAFDQRNNLLVSFIGNGLFLMDIKNALKTENWIQKHKNTVKKWFDVVAFFDAQNSLANFVYNHQSYSFPTISEEKNSITTTDLGHPLLNPKKRIDNNFRIKKEQFFIITGANMAGKSTFLRTISLSIVMANCGLPVCATSFTYCPIKLITSMRTSDSLSDDESYFYAELKRLKFIVDKTQTDRYFIVLDEILKGTNSKDKAIGSKKFVEKLSQSKSTGIIATHDISLCKLSEENTQIKNYYFDAEIVNDELYFDYRIKKGVCKNMNASFLLKKMNII